MGGYKWVRDGWDVPVVKAIAITAGIRYACTLFAVRVVVESDSLNLVCQLYNRRVDLSMTYFHLTDVCRPLDSHPHISVAYVRRSANTVVDTLAHGASSNQVALSFDYEYPIFIAASVMSDAIHG
ncbi:hypothetical protein F3Y22_tig00110505pilonHSYRG00300 [Hibiscus syriacus]|uniref:RNase H type-1 domain-containing protein n=1 Tax=Hibiscus syriacus TaxID=106335 RepID=A0A6A3ABI3_HIBSY|nr:hypothetical protein F3Y22_tig00110505pilonHSYRG00300 [Hibiscus syriacus]